MRKKLHQDIQREGCPSARQYNLNQARQPQLARSQIPVLAIHPSERCLVLGQKVVTQAEHANFLREEVHGEKRVKILALAVEWSAVKNQARFFPAHKDVDPEQEERRAQE